MKFSQFVVTAFVANCRDKNDNCRQGITTSSTPLRLIPVDHQAVDISNQLERTFAHSYDKTALKFETAWSISKKSSMTRTSVLSNGIIQWVEDNILIPPASAASLPAPPTKDEVKLLREAFAAFYGTDRDLEKAETLLSQAIDAWQRQPDDEQAGLYRVRADCYMAMVRPADAENDYSKAITLLQGPGGKLADEAELPASLLGRARAIRSQGVKVTKAQADTAANDYQLSLRLSSREDWDTDEEKEEDGAMRNPYAAWEWGSALRLAGDYDKAAKIHTLASEYFDDIGDRARSVISAIDVGIDLASSSTTSSEKVIKSLTTAIQRTTTVEGRDVKLLQRVIAKEGEGRIALASVLWDAGERREAESQLGQACTRLDQLEADAIARQKKMGELRKEPERVKFSIDDGVGALDTSCSRFKNEDFVTSKLQWPSNLQAKLMKLYSLKA